MQFTKPNISYFPNMSKYLYIISKIRIESKLISNYLPVALMYILGKTKPRLMLLDIKRSNIIELVIGFQGYISQELVTISG